MRLKEKVALITGGSRGIGKGIALGLAREGAHIVLAARGAEALNHAAQELGALGTAVLAVPTDVADEGQVEALFNKAMVQFGRLDILINNAGLFSGGPLDEFSIEAWDQVMAVNLRGPFLCTRAALRTMKKQGEGRIINIGSIAAQRVRPNSAAYSTSKHGLWGLTQVTALEGRAYGITCGCLHPGNTSVERNGSDLATNQEPMMTVTELVEVIILMSCLPRHVNMLEAIVLPTDQLYLGRG